jgi:hypothetical protein
LRRGYGCGIGSALWRAGRWLDGKARLGEADGRLSKLEDTASWLDANAAGLPRLAVCDSNSHCE